MRKVGVEVNCMTEKDNNNGLVIRRLSRVEAYMAVSENKRRIEGFLDRNGYSVREVRGIATHAIALWETQRG